MKSKISPTSPQAKKNNQQDKELDNYYKSSLSNIEKPNKRKTPIWFLFVVIIFGFIAGILGQLVLLSYGSEIPYLDKLDIFSLTENQPFFINYNNNKNKVNDTEINKILDNNKNSIVQIFEKNISTDNINSLYIPENQLGLGVAITNDGYIITTDQVISDDESEYVAITENKEIYLVNEIIKDPVTNFYILTTDFSNLKAANLSEQDDVSNSEEIVIVNKYGFGNNLHTEIAITKDINYKVVSSIQDYFNSTEKISETILLDSNDTMLNSLAFGLDGQAIGLTSNQNGHVIVYPFYLITDKISSILENNQVIRPFMGINYLNLSNLANFSGSLSQEQTKGALIYYDEDGNFPGIISNSPAEKAGLLSNDIILTVNNVVINGDASLSEIIQNKNAGDIITLKILREGEELEIKLTLESLG